MTLPGLRSRVWLAALAVTAVDACNRVSDLPVRVGIVLDGDGERGAQLAADDINAEGGINGRRLELRILRGQSTTEARVALAAADSLARDSSIVAVVGHTNSGASLAAAQIYNDSRIVQIAPTSTAPLYSEAGPFSFRLVASDSHQGAYLAGIIGAEHPIPRFALLYVNDDYGRALQSILARRLAANGAAPVYQAPYAEAERFTDVEGMAGAIAQARTEVLVWIGRWPELLRLLPEIRKRLPEVRVLASDGLSGSYVRVDTNHVFAGVRYVRFVDMGNPTPAVARLRERYQQRWVDEFTDQYLLAYDAVRILGEAIRSVGTDRTAVRDYLASLGTKRPPYRGIGGPVAFDEHGDPKPSYALVEVTKRGSRSVDAKLPSKTRSQDDGR